MGWNFARCERARGFERRCLDDLSWVIRRQSSEEIQMLDRASFVGLELAAALLFLLIELSGLGEGRVHLPIWPVPHSKIYKKTFFSVLLSNIYVSSKIYHSLQHSYTSKKHTSPQFL